MKRFVDNTLSSIVRSLGRLKAQAASYIGLRDEECDDQDFAPDPPHYTPPRALRGEFPSIDSGKRAQSIVYQTLWLRDLVSRLRPGVTESAGDGLSEDLSWPDFGEITVDEAFESTRRMLSLLYATFKSLALEFNELIAGHQSLANLRISTTDVSEVKEQLAQPQADEPALSDQTKVYLRSRASSSSWSLSIRGSPGKIEFFLVPAAEIFLLSQSETSVRLKSVLTMNSKIDADVWTIDGLTADPDELFYLVRGLFRSLLVATALNTKEELLGAHILQNLEGEALRETVKQIILTEQNMAQKIVSQQEEIQNRIARDLHDAVIADIMSLKRSLAGDKPLLNDEVGSILDQISARLREICHDLAPRDLKDWGLQTVIEDLVERLAQRTGADCSFMCDGEVPELPYQVQLHIYRIVQESLNNIEKYAQATKIVVKFEVTPQTIKLTLRDNGRGFTSADGESRSKKEGGTGLSGIKERTEMIRCFFPARLLVVSKPGKGSFTTLEVRI